MPGRPDDPTVRLERWDGPVASDDPDANFKREVAAYSQQDPLFTLRNMARNLDLPVGALARYVLAKWAAAGSEALLELGPSVVDRMSAAIAQAEEAGSEAARLEAYEQLRQVISWLRIPLDDPDVNPAGGA
ncbi:MAG: hypothetical protein KY469_02945 [Actinobacteria bacterium]|nr:hypothetical protein [Actinomycetota bacterium]